MTKEEDAINKLIDAKEGYKQYLTDEAIDLSIKAIKQTMWIPVSERLPEPLEGEYKDYSNWVLVTANLAVDLDRNNNELDVCPAYYCFSEDRWYYINNRRFAANVITAWKPLPEPYKESEVK